MDIQQLTSKSSQTLNKFVFQVIIFSEMVIVSVGCVTEMTSRLENEEIFILVI